MKLLFSLAIVFASVSRAGESADRAGIRAAMASIQWDREPWSETTEPRIVNSCIRFITRDVALVEGDIRQYGSVILLRSLPVTVVLRKRASSWKVVSVRIGCDCLPPPGVKCERRCACEP